MVQFQILSDIHLEMVSKHPKPPVLAPNLVLAGDIGKVDSKLWKQFIDFCSVNWVHVFYVLGNHEFYHEFKSYEQLNREYADFFSQFPNVHLLDNSSYELDGIDIYGFVGWTRSPFPTQNIAQNKINDYNYISDDLGNLITPRFITRIAEDSINQFKTWIDSRSGEQDHNKPILIITHFPPISTNTSNPIYLSEPRIVNQYFAWENLIKSEEIQSTHIHTWISGHTHWSYDFIDSDNKIRYIGNQIGYRSELGDTRFNPKLVIDVPAHTQENNSIKLA